MTAIDKEQQRRREEERQRREYERAHLTLRPGVELFTPDPIPAGARITITIEGTYTYAGIFLKSRV